MIHPTLLLLFTFVFAQAALAQLVQPAAGPAPAVGVYNKAPALGEESAPDGDDED